MVSTVYQQAHKEEKDNSLTHAYIAVGVSLVVASFAAVLIRLTQNAGMPSPMVATGRLFLSCLILTPIVTRRYWGQIKRLKWHEIARACGAGMFIGIHFMLMVYALEHTTILIGQVITNTGPLWVAILETVFLRAKLPRGVYFGLMFTFIGGGIIGVTSALTPAPVDYLAFHELAPFAMTDMVQNPLLGAVLAMFSAIAASFYLTLGRSVRSKIALIPYVWMVYGTGAFIGLIVVVFTQTPVFGHPSLSYVYLLLLTLGPQLVGHSGFNYAVAYLPATVVSISTQAVTVSAAIIAFFLFAEIPTWLDMLGSGVIGLGVLIAIVSQRKKQAKA